MNDKLEKTSDITFKVTKEEADLILFMLKHEDRRMDRFFMDFVEEHRIANYPKIVYPLL